MVTLFGINYLAVFVAAVAAFVASTIWYIVFGRARMELLGRDPSRPVDKMKPQPLKMLAEIARSLVVAYVLARFVVLLGIVGWTGALPLAVWVWIGFPVMILLGSVQWENVPFKLAAIHAGDWLVKLVLMAAILGAWH